MASQEQGETQKAELLIKAVTRTEALKKINDYGYAAALEQCGVSVSHSMIALSEAGVVTGDDLTVLTVADKKVAKVTIGEDGTAISQHIGHIQTGTEKHAKTKFVRLLH